MSSDNSDNSPGRGVFTPVTGNTPGRVGFSSWPGRGNSPGRGRGNTSQSQQNYGRGYGSPGQHTNNRGFTSPGRQTTGRGLTSPGRQTHINGIAKNSYGRGRGFVTLNHYIFNQQGQQSHGRGSNTPNQQTPSTRGFVGNAYVPAGQQFGRGYGQQADDRKFSGGRGTYTNKEQGNISF